MKQLLFGRNRKGKDWKSCAENSAEMEKKMNKKWWHDKVAYQIYPKSFCDANGDGICDNSKYSINYKLCGGKNNKKNPTCYYNGKSVKLKNLTRKNYVFKGWYTDKNYKNKVTTIKKGSVGKKTLYAKWKKK